MKTLTTISICACLAVAVTSCSKKSSTTTPTTPGSSSSPTINYGDVDGGLVSLKTDLVTMVSGFPYAVTTETGIAVFFTSTGNNSSYIDGGTVSVNSYSLDKQTNNSYLKTASVGMTPADLNFGSGNSNWSVGGAGSVPAFTYNDNTVFPLFEGTVPDSVTRSNGVTVSLSGNISNADSVMLFVAAGSKYVSHTVAGSATSVSLSASDLSSLPVVTDKTAVAEVIAYRVSVQAEGGKHYAFIKEHAYVMNVNIK